MEKLDIDRQVMCGYIDWRESRNQNGRQKRRIRRRQPGRESVFMKKEETRR